MFVRLKPLDTVFVREARRFNANEAHAADSIFPPPPNVCFGAWRGAIITACGLKESRWGAHEEKAGWPEWFGDAETPGVLRQRGPIPFYSMSAWYPIPADCYFDGAKKRLLPFRLVKNDETASPSTTYIYDSPEGIDRLSKPGPRHLMNQESLTGYLNELPSQGMVVETAEQSELWTTERRTNVGMSSEHNAGENGRLFSLGHTRPAPDLSLICEWLASDRGDQHESLNWLKGQSAHFLNLGGETRAASVASLNFTWPPAPQLIRQIGKRALFKLYFATPAYFKDGWCHGSATAAVFATDDDSVEARIEAFAGGKPLSLGGYNIAAQCERPMRRFAPAGSVYLLSVEKELSDKVLNLHGRTVGDDPFARAQGFGLVFVGTPNSDFLCE